MKIIAMTLVLAFATCAAQRINHVTLPPSSLAKGISWAPDVAHVLGPNKHEAVFTMVTSWIPGEGHRGFIRYQLNAVGEGVSLKDAPSFIEELHVCTYTLLLYDSENFILRRVPIIFMRTTDDSGDITSMNANDLAQMDMSEYESFIKDGRWQVSWACNVP